MASQENGVIAIVTGLDGKPWANYLQAELNLRTDCLLSSVEIVELEDCHKQITQSRLQAACAVLFVVTDLSSQFLDKNEAKGKKLFENCLWGDHVTGILFYLGIQKDLAEPRLLKCYEGLRNWKFRVYNPEESGNDSTAVQIQPILECVLKLFEKSCELANRKITVAEPEAVSSSQEEEGKMEDSYGPVIFSESPAPVPESPVPSTAPRNPIPKPKKRTKGYKDLTCTLVPETVRCEEEAEVAICFNKEVQKEKVKVFLEETEEEDKVTILVETTQVNPMTLKFKTAERPGGVVFVVVKQEDNPDPTQCLCSTQLKFETNIGVIDGVNHLLLCFLDKTCARLKEKTPLKSMKELDNEFKAILQDDTLDIPARAFEWLFGMYEFAESENRRQEIPTLLHFGAKYGFQEFVSALLEFPGGALANSIENKVHKQPSDIAREYNHFELHQVLQNFTDLEKEVYNAYVVMHGYDVGDHPPHYLKKYYNAVRSRGLMVNPVIYSDGKEDYYLTMNKHSNTRNLPPRQKGPGGDDEDVYDYTEVDPSNPQIQPMSAGVRPPPRLNKPPAQPPPGSTTDPLKLQTIADPMRPFNRTTMERDQAEADMTPAHMKELIDIQNDVKKGELSIEDAQILFYEWTLNNKTTLSGTSFQDKKTRLEEISKYKEQRPAQTAATSEVMTNIPLLTVDSTTPVVSPKPKKGFFNFLGRGKKEKQTKETSISVPNIPEDKMLTLPEQAHLDRISTASTSSVSSSNSSRDSRTSRTSTSSRDSGACVTCHMDHIPEQSEVPDAPIQRRRSSGKARLEERKSLTDICHNSFNKPSDRLPPKLPPKGRSINQRRAPPAEPESQTDGTDDTDFPKAKPPPPPPKPGKNK